MHSRSTSSTAPGTKIFWGGVDEGFILEDSCCGGGGGGQGKGAESGGGRKDTVASVGSLYGRTLSFATNNEAIRVFRHALSFDEVRTYGFYQRSKSSTFRFSRARP